MNCDAFDHKEQLGTLPIRAQREDDTVTPAEAQMAEPAQAPLPPQSDAVAVQDDGTGAWAGLFARGRTGFFYAGFLDGAARAYEMILTAFGMAICRALVAFWARMRRGF